MQIIGPMPVGPVGPVGLTTPALDLKSLQRVTADILQVNRSQIVLFIDGVPVVADVLSSELAAELKGRPSAQFLVSHMEDGKTVLRLVNPTQTPPGLGVSSGESSENLTLHLLKAYGLPLTAETQIAAQAAINQRLPLQPGQMEQLMRTLSGLPGWGEREANLAAAILSSGLPLTPQSLELAARPAGMVNETFTNLLGQLNIALQDPDLPAEIRDLVNAVTQTLKESVLDAGAPAKLPEKLAQAVNLLGRPLENLLAEEARQSNSVASIGLASMASLQQEAGRTGKLELARMLDDFMQDLSKAQWQNIPSTAQNRREDWVEAALWMRLPNPEQGMENIPIRLRIDRPPEDRQQKIDADHAHIIVQVELPDHRLFQVKIGLNQRQVIAEVIVPDEPLVAVAREELPALAENLQEQGYLLGETQVELGAPDQVEKVSVLPAWGADLTGVDLVA
jgi:hypothetical protein